ncbi:acetyl esterase [Pseudaminobacter salicylatoxidans]|uniref:Acetyl esterase n=1 Tax=Pseudaminobacter salicylatoxidans TaxID=93369 RepID=A0A316C078_PSESE|nr:alpha/beta hydrolase [Pseudaminobacter salicylatoxidans]PWJ80982.1 acetyl esterase [Pseudaminobacter salicylatoxidans]
MTDYSKLIDAETWAFIDRTNSFYPPDAVDHSVDEQRRTYDRMCREFHAGYPAGVTATDSAVETPTHKIPVRIYRNAEPNDAAMVLYFHGGGFILGGLDSHDDVCAEICERTGYEVVSVDYRLVPEHTHPAAYDDCRAAFEWATKTYAQPIVLCGDSAGGNLAAAVSHTTRGHARAAIGQVLIYPGLGGKLGQGSYVTHYDAPLLSVRDMDYYRDMRAGGRDISKDATFAPFNDEDYSDLPPTAVITAECDPLSDDGRDYRDRIQAAGGKAWWFDEPGLVHGHLRARHSVGRARESFTRIVEAVRALGKGDWPY